MSNTDTFKITGPGWYLRRNGKRQRVDFKGDESYGDFCWIGPHESHGAETWREDGRYHEDVESPLDLIAPAPPEPKKKLVPWASREELPIDAWYSTGGFGDWYKINGVSRNSDPCIVRISCQWISLTELSSRVYTLDPFCAKPETHPCGKWVEVTE